MISSVVLRWIDRCCSYSHDTPRYSGCDSLLLGDARPTACEVAARRHFVLSAVVVLGGSSVSWQVTDTVEAIVVLPPWFTPCVAVSAVGCVMEIILIFRGSGVPLRHPQFSIQEISNFSLVSDGS